MKVRCELCPFRCVLDNGERGVCRVRMNINGELYSLVYGKPSAVHVDPIEKKPIFHITPGKPIFSIATAGCNLGCEFCQNWQLSQSNPEDLYTYDLPPQKVVNICRERGINMIAYTYSEPIVFYEYMYDTAFLAKKRGIKNIWITAGFINKKPLKKLARVITGANIDLKGFSEEYYHKICHGALKPVLEAIKLSYKLGVWIELTNLIVTTLNDDMDMIKRMVNWILKELSPNVPLHFSRFFPMYKLNNLPPTPLETLIKAREIAMREGLYYVYVGNIYVKDGETTFCPNCKKPLIIRKGFFVEKNVLRNGRCPYCNTKIAGIWK